MFQKFFTKTIESKFIKNLLDNTYLPIYKVVGNSDYIFKNNTYIYNSRIIKCTKSGQLGDYIWNKYNIDEYNKLVSVQTDYPMDSPIATKSELEDNNIEIYLFVSDHMTLIDNQYIMPDNHNIVKITLTSTGIADLSDINQLIKNKFVQIQKYITLDPEKEPECITGQVFVTNSSSSITYANDELNYNAIYTTVWADTEIKSYKGAFAGQEKNTNYNAYPADGISGRYWYTQISEVTQAIGIAEYSVISRYRFDEYYPEYTERHTSEFGYYDSETHKYLGKYLRCLNKLYDLNLNPFYNCYTGELANNFYIRKVYTTPTGATEPTLSYSIENTPNANYKVMQVPIKFNQTYTIAIDSNAEILMAPIFIKNNRFVSGYSDSLKIDLTREVLAIKPVELKTKLQFKRPFTYRINLAPTVANAEILDLNEQNLYLLIQQSAVNNSSLVVLEGDYTKSDNCMKHFDFVDIEYLTTEQKNRLFINTLSLLRVNTGEHYAFSDKLIEYLTLNVITHLDEIGENISAAQEASGLAGRYGIIDGVWSDYVRAHYFNSVLNETGVERVDTTGFVDKLVENLYMKEV